MKVSIRKNDYGFEWKADHNPRWYSIQLEQIFPDKFRPTIVENCKNGKCLSYNFAEYNRTNKILFISNVRFI